MSSFTPQKIADLKLITIKIFSTSVVEMIENMERVVTCFDDTELENKVKEGFENLSASFLENSKALEKDLIDLIEQLKSEARKK